METILCDMSALRFWRTPPIVRLLATGQEADTPWESLVSEADAAELRTALLHGLPLCRSFATGPSWRHSGEHARNLRDCFMLFAPSLTAPIDIMATNNSERSYSELIKPRLWTGELPSGSIVPITDTISVASPTFALQQVVARVGLVRGLMMASELCGNFAVYKAPGPIADLLNRLLLSDKVSTARGARRLLSLEGDWSPCIANNKITDLWSRPPLIEPHEIESFCGDVGAARGRATALEIASLVKPGAASPLEVQTGMLLGLSKRRGGEGFSGFEFNKRVQLSPRAKLLYGKEACYCDLFFEEASLDIECQSTLIHNNQGSLISDFNRSAALNELGINVLFASHEIMLNPRRFDAFADLVAKRLGVARRKQSEAHVRAAGKLRAELFCDWKRLM